jgi:membrane protease YdiL (CAAX protease family)
MSRTLYSGASRMDVKGTRIMNVDMGRSALGARASGRTRDATRADSRVNRRGVLWFIAIAYGLAWLLEAPLWLDGRGLNSPWLLLTLLVNFTPAIATLIVTRWISPLPEARKALGLRWGVKGSRWGLYWLFGLVGFTLFNVASPFIGALFGRFPLDLTHFSYLTAALQSNPGGQQLLSQTSVSTIALVIVLTLPLQALIGTPFTFGEELGWRGYLLPQLLPLGQWPALVLSGVIWSLWHAPLILLGFNYPQHANILGLLVMTAFCTIYGTLLGWTRLATGSIWPAVLGHAALDANQFVGGVLVLLQANVTFDTAVAPLTGWTGWLLPLLFIAFLVATRRLPVRNLPTLVGPS